MPSLMTIFMSSRGISKRPMTVESAHFVGRSPEDPEEWPEPGGVNSVPLVKSGVSTEAALTE
jgi:hypothetical protein